MKTGIIQEHLLSAAVTEAFVDDDYALLNPVLRQEVGEGGGVMHVPRYTLLQTGSRGSVSKANITKTSQDPFKKAFLEGAESEFISLSFNFSIQPIAMLWFSGTLDVR